MPKRGSRKKISTSYCHICRLSLPSVEKLNQHIVEVHKNLPCSSGLSRASSSEVSTTLNRNISKESVREKMGFDEVKEPYKRVLRPRVSSRFGKNSSKSSKSKEMTSSELNSSINQSSDPDNQNFSESISFNANQVSAPPHPNFSNLNCTNLLNHSDIPSIQNQQPLIDSSFKNQLNSLSENISPSLNQPFIMSQICTSIVPAAQQNVNTFEFPAENVVTWFEELKELCNQFNPPLPNQLLRSFWEVKIMTFKQENTFQKHPDDVKDALNKAFDEIVTIHDYYSSVFKC